MKHVLGTGLSGLVGSRVVELLKKYSFSDASLDTGVDILNFTQLENFFQKHSDTDTVLHMAAFTDTNVAWDEKNNRNGVCWRLNVEGTDNIIKLCQKYSKYLIFISTDYVFDGSKEEPYVELDKPKPLDWYGETKYEAEKLVQGSGINASIVRISYPFRANFPQKIDLTRKILGKLQKGESVNLFSDQTTTPTFIDDIALGLEQIIEQRPSDTFHLVASSHQTVYEMGLCVAQVFNLDTSLVKPTSLRDYLKTPGIRPFAINGMISNVQTKKILGIEMRDYTDGLVEMKKQMS